MAASWLQAVPGQDKAYNFLIGTSAAAILFGKEFIPYTADIVYAIPFSAVIYVMYSQAGPMIGGLTKSVLDVRPFMHGVVAVAVADAGCD